MKNYLIYEPERNGKWSEEKNFIYGTSVYHQICMPISKKLLSNYISERVPSIKLKKDTYKVLSFFENTFVKINYSNIIIKTNRVISSIYKIFHVYHENILVCDFKNNKFFWLDKAIKNGNPKIN